MDNDPGRSDMATRLLRNVMFVESFDTVEKSLFREWKLCKNRDERERLWVATDVLAKIKTAIRAVAYEGSLPKKNMEEIKGKKSLRSKIW